MNDTIENLLEDFHKNDDSSPNELSLVENVLGIRLPVDYRDFLGETNGGEGFIGKQYIIIWRAKDLLPFNREYEVAKYAPGIFLFASSGGGEGFGYDTRSEKLPIVQIPFVGLDLRYAKQVANSFTEFLIKMKASNGSLL
jgi:hypothetical protein